MSRQPKRRKKQPMNQLELQFTTSGLEVAGITIPYLLLSIELFLIGLLIILEVVLLLRLKFRATRTKHLREQTQVYTRSGGDKEEVQHRTEARERQHIQQQVWTLPQAATAVQKIATSTGQRLADKFCSHCGQLMPSGAAFCSQCGALLVASESGYLRLPPSSPLETSSAQHVLDKSALYSGDEPPQSFPSALPAPDVLDKSAPYSGDGQIAPAMSE